MLFSNSTIKGTDSTKNVTDDHTMVTPSNLHNRHNYRHLTNDPVYRIIQNIPLGKRSVHDIRLIFSVNGAWSALCSKYKQNERSKDIQLIPCPWTINNLNLKITVHSTDTVRIDVGCSYCPVAVDVDGVVRLSNALADFMVLIVVKDSNQQSDQASHYRYFISFVTLDWVVYPTKIIAI